MLRSAIEMLACRATGSAFCATAKVTVPSPWPSTVEVKVIQLAGVAAFHEQSRVVPTERLPVPPVEPNVVEDIPTFAWQRVAAGAVTDVDVFAEPPQPKEKRARERDSRDAERAITAQGACMFFATTQRAAWPTTYRGFLAKHRSSTTLPPMRCS